VSLALFDLDNTLLAGDSDYLWGVFLAEQGLVDGKHYERENERFYQEYKQGRLDIFEFLRFSLKALSETEPQRLRELHRRFMAEKIRPIITQSARDLLQEHRDKGDTLLIITATNSFVTAPIAEYLQVPHLLATEPEIRDGRYTGEVQGTPCFQGGKVERLNAWLADSGLDMSDSYFYSDSHNDLPLLEKVDHPVAVDPDDSLKAAAEARDWPIISLRG
jgi:HAD superfamily hydrolase (TIGR01490 family)